MHFSSSAFPAADRKDESPKDAVGRSRERATLIGSMATSGSAAEARSSRLWRLPSLVIGGCGGNSLDVSSDASADEARTLTDAPAQSATGSANGAGGTAGSAGGTGGANGFGGRSARDASGNGDTGPDGVAGRAPPADASAGSPTDGRSTTDATQQGSGSVDGASPPLQSLDAGPMPGPCGTLGHACCAADAGVRQCAAATACSPYHVCVTCGGGLGELCRPSGTPLSGGGCNDAAAACVQLPASPAPTCVACGMADGICCAGKTCKEANTACLAMPPMGYICRKCGDKGERCCSDHTTAAASCQAGLKCNPIDIGDQCGP